MTTYDVWGTISQLSVSPDEAEVMLPPDTVFAVHDMIDEGSTSV